MAPKSLSYTGQSSIGRGVGLITGLESRGLGHVMSRPTGQTLKPRTFAQPVRSGCKRSVPVIGASSTA